MLTCFRGTTLLALIPTAMLLSAAGREQHSRMMLVQSAQGVFGGGGSVQASSAKLRRTEDALVARIKTTHLPAGAYSVWWVIFNNPAACSGPCDDPDLANPATMASIFYATGGVVGSSGAGHFSAYLEVGELPEDPAQIELPGPPLKDPFAADVYLVLRYHGPVTSRILSKQIGTRNGGCIGGSGILDDPEPADRLFRCYDPQGVFFPAHGDANHRN